MAEAATIEERLARVEGRLEEQSRILARPATKEDIGALKGDLNKEIAALKGDLTTIKNDFNNDIAALKSDIVHLETRIDRIFYLILGSWITLAIFIGGLYFR